MSTSFQKITEQILALMKGGNILPWRRPWESGFHLPTNVKTKKPYRGANVILLWVEASRKGYSCPYWGTAKTWKCMGGKVKDNETPIEVSFVAYIQKGKKRIPYTRDFQVFNSAQVESKVPAVPVFGGYEPAEAIINGSGAEIHYEGERAVYDIPNDRIYMPPRMSFQTPAAFYTTVLHELSHWTGKRLHRQFGDSMQSPIYANEELIAELSSCFTCAAINVPQALAEMPRHASYIAEWTAILEADHRAIFRAASAAQRASEYLVRCGKGVRSCVKKAS